MKKCPHCSLLNTNEAEVCDCGFVFASGRLGTPIPGAMVKDSRTPHPRAGFLARAWRGDERLWKVWWYIGAPLAIAGRVTEKLVATDPFTALVSSVALLVAYIAWCSMAWRCAPNVDNKIWTPIARVVIVLGLLRTALQLVSVFQPGSRSP